MVVDVKNGVVKRDGVRYLIFGEISVLIEVYITRISMLTDAIQVVVNISIPIQTASTPAPNYHNFAPPLFLPAPKLSSPISDVQRMNVSFKLGTRYL